MYKTLTAIFEHHQGVNSTRLQTSRLNQKLIDSGHFADRITGVDESIEVAVAAYHA